MGQAKTSEEKRAALLLKYRKLKVERIEREAEKIVYYLSHGDRKIVMMIIISQGTIGISYVRDLKKLVDEEEAAKGIMVGSGKYTYSARSTSRKMGIELIPPTLPVFDIFEHELVPKHRILSEGEKNDVLEKFHSKPYQFPWVKASDHVSIILGAEPGDIIKITGESETAGRAESYRYVVK